MQILNLDQYKHVPVSELPSWEAAKLDLMLVTLKQPRLVIINDFFLTASEHLYEISSILKEYAEGRNIVMLISNDEAVICKLCNMRYKLDS